MAEVCTLITISNFIYFLVIRLEHSSELNWNIKDDPEDDLRRHRMIQRNIYRKQSRNESTMETIISSLTYIFGLKTCFHSSDEFIDCLKKITGTLIGGENVTMFLF